MQMKSCGIIGFNKKYGDVQFLLVKHLAGHWAFPKGTQEKGESDLQTAQREFIEETGIKDFNILDMEPFTEKYSFVLSRENEKVEKAVLYFLAEVKDTKVRVQEKEIQEYRWVIYAEALKLITHRGTAELLKQCYSFIS